NRPERFVSTVVRQCMGLGGYDHSSYVSTEGERVISSFNPSNATPENSALSAAGTAAAMSVGEMLLLRGTGKLLLGEYGVGAKAGEKVYAYDGI
ncbi:hypothetical protein, partial [Pseudomonas viridiflava]|uniref:hypothetical protein n=1 Tax=Pseudomonas viridiflava TaxID=33069 RepID=UPI00197DCAD2